ncbi:vascular endothelial growth factor B isoform X1 [Rana temporaria]|uniref:vascular endothelial growth factor B isoform X1 n=2 Tax=Rana temporaria TaxID=8407 RepID=UPI001AADE202|nr:vascular endothelial growth factor B isoform X1 [Rana temporaria]
MRQTGEVNAHTFSCDTSKSWTSTIGSSDLGLASKDNLQDKGPLYKMDCVLPSSLVWLCVLLQCILTPISMCQTQENQTLEGRSWSDIYNRSKCQPRWVLLNLLREFPQFSEFLFKPACVSVQRCAGCCLDEAQSCFPLQSHIVKMEVIITNQVLRIRSPHEEYTNISVIQNTDCECRPRDSDMLRPSRLSTTLGLKKPKKRRRKGKKGMHNPKNARSVCPPCDQRRTLNPENCECVCQKNEKKCNQRGLIFNQERCRCEKPRS